MWYGVLGDPNSIFCFCRRGNLIADRAFDLLTGCKSVYTFFYKNIFLDISVKYSKKIESRKYSKKYIFLSIFAGVFNVLKSQNWQKNNDLLYFTA